MTKTIRELIDKEYKGHERIFSGKDNEWKRYSECILKGFIKALYLTNKLTKAEYDNELDVIKNMY